MKNKNNEVIKVSDWSQKYKLAIYAISGTGMIYVGFQILYWLKIIAENTAK